MLILLSSLFSFFNCLFYQSENSYRIQDLRHFLEKSAKDRVACERFIAHLENYRGKDPVVLGFRAASIGVMAKHAWSPYHKIKYLRSSARMFEQVIAAHPNVPELRFLRYTVEFFIPRYLNMSPNLEEDKKVFLSHMAAYPRSDLDAEACQIMRIFLLRHPENLTEAERKFISKLKV